MILTKNVIATWVEYPGEDYNVKRDAAIATMVAEGKTDGYAERDYEFNPMSVIRGFSDQAAAESKLTRWSTS